MENIKEFKILNLRKNKTSTNSITLRLSPNEKIEIEPRSFNPLNKFEETNLKKENNVNYSKPETAAQYEPVITSSDFNSFRDDFSKVNLGLITNTTNPINSISTDRNNYTNINNQYKNISENTTKNGFDYYYIENSQKKKNYALHDKGYSMNSY